MPDRLVAAERAGLRLAIALRTAVLGIFLVWVLAVGDQETRRVGIVLLGCFVGSGIAYLPVIGTRYDRWWLKYAIYSTDLLVLTALFAVVPLSGAGDVPQIIAFRAYGAYYLLLPIALSTLALSPRFVVWTGLVACAGWWAAWGWVVAGMERAVSWSDLPPLASEADYLAVFLSPDFIGVGNRVEETAFTFAAAVILAVAVHRARRVFIAQIVSDKERAQVTRILGQFVPEAVARRIVEDDRALAPQRRRATILCLDIAGFTTIAETMPPEDVIAMLNGFLADANDVVSAAGGVVIDFVGDGFLAAFGTPLVIPSTEQMALKAAEGLIAMVDDKPYGGRTLKIRIGLATGEVAAGSVGGERRQAFTIYGDTVNLAARLQELNKRFDTRVLLDADTALKTDAVSDLRAVGSHAIRGRSATVDLFAFEPRATGH